MTPNTRFFFLNCVRFQKQTRYTFPFSPPSFVLVVSAFKNSLLAFLPLDSRRCRIGNCERRRSQSHRDATIARSAAQILRLLGRGLRARLLSILPATWSCAVYLDTRKEGSTPALCHFCSGASPEPVSLLSVVRLRGVLLEFLGVPSPPQIHT